MKIAHRDPNSPDVWTCRMQVQLRDCPHLLSGEKLAFRQSLEKKMGSRSQFIRSFIYGDSVDAGGRNKVFTELDMKRLRDLMYDPDIKVPGIGNDLRGASDFSGGGDEQTLFIRSGNIITHYDFFHYDDTHELAKEIVGILRRHNIPPHCYFADNGGLGKPIIDAMEGEYGYAGIVRYYNNKAAMNQAEYKDCIAEDTYHLKQLLHDPGIRFLVKDGEFVKQCRDREFDIDEYNRVQLQKKDRHRKEKGYSPDRLETMVMLFSGWDPGMAVQVDDGEVTSPTEMERYAREFRRAERMASPRVQPDVNRLNVEARRKSGAGVREPYHWERQGKQRR